jgi:putative ABC transport system permease protein
VSFDAGSTAGAADRTVAIRTVSPSYFDVMGIPLIEGRMLASTDRGSSAPVVVVNQAFVRRFSAGSDLRGWRVMFEFFTGNPRWEIVGVVGDEQFEALDRAPVPVVYFPFAQDTGGEFSLVLRSAADPAQHVPAARTAVAELDAGLPLFQVRPMEQIIGESEPVFLRQQVLALLVLFGTAALLVSAIGLYGILAHIVAQQRREIGLRLALGATTGEVARMVLGRGLRPAIVGVLAGLVMATFAGRALRALLFEVPVIDPLSIGVVAAVLIGVAIAACVVPTLRAIRVDPATALKPD